MTIQTTPLGTYDGQSYTPSPALVAELTTDPAHKGYKNADGSWKPAGQIGRLLCDPDGVIANPTPQATVPKPFAFGDVMALLSANSLANVLALPELPRILDDINNQNRPAVLGWAALAIAGTSPPITQTEHDAIVALMQATQPDPNWPATVPDASRLEKVFSAGAIQAGFILAVNGGVA